MVTDRRIVRRGGARRGCGSRSRPRQYGRQRVLRFRACAGSFGARGGVFVRFRAFGGSWRSALSGPPPLLHICILAYLPLSQKIASMAWPSILASNVRHPTGVACGSLVGTIRASSRCCRPISSWRLLCLHYDRRRFLALLSYNNASLLFFFPTDAPSFPPSSKRLYGYHLGGFRAI